MRRRRGRSTRRRYMAHGWGEEWNKLKLANLKEGNHSIFQD